MLEDGELKCWKDNGKPNKTNAAAVGSKQANMTTRVFEDWGNNRLTCSPPTVMAAAKCHPW
jgi:hypothetical protein